MSASLSGVFNIQEFTDLGVLGAGMRLYTYVPATTTQKVAYTDAAGSIAHAYTSDGLGGQYLALNSRGELPAPLFLTSGGYDLTLKTSAGVTVWTRRAVGGDDAGSTLRADLASTSDAAKGSGLIGFTYALAYGADTIGGWLKDLSLAAGSTFIGWAHSFAGAVTRTLRDRLRDTIHSKDFGVVADGTTDDTTALQAFVDACKNRKGVLQAGKIKITAQITLDITNYRYHIVGELYDPFGGDDGTTIYNAGTGHAIYAVSTGVEDFPLVLENFTVAGTSASLDGLHLKNVHGARLTNLWITSNGRYGVNMEKCWASHLAYCTITQNGRDGLLLNLQSNQVTVLACAINTNSRSDGYANIRMTGTPGFENLGITLIGCDTSGAGSAPYTTVTTAYGIAAQYTRGLSIIGHYAEGNKTANLYADNTNKSMEARNNYWQDGVNTLDAVEGLDYSHNNHKFNTITTTANIIGSTITPMSVKTEGNTVEGGATLNFTAGVKQRSEHYDTAAPAAGAWAVGDLVWHRTPAAAGFIGWVCTTAGTPGTWKTWGAISA